MITCQSAKGKVVIQSKALRDEFRPGSEAHESYRQDHECYGQPNHAALGVINVVLHLGGNVGLQNASSNEVSQFLFTGGASEVC